MLQVPASSLSPGEQFSTLELHGKWHTVKTTREAARGERVVIIDTDGKEHIFKASDQVVINV